MKNTVLALTSSAVATLFILIGVFAAMPEMHGDLFYTFWIGVWLPGNLGWIFLIFTCVIAVLAFVFASREKMGLSYGLGALAGVLLGVLMDMLVFMDAILT